MRLFFIQIVKGEHYADMADRQYLNSPTTFNRGSIYFQDRKGNLVSAATLKQQFTLTVNPQLIKDIEGTYTKLASVAPLAREDFMEKVQKKGSVHAELAKELSDKQAEAINTFDLPGVFLVKEKRRFYPAGMTAAHVLGFMAFQDEEYAGRYGLEKYYENVLQHEQTGSFASFFAEVFLGFGKNLLAAPGATKEGDLVLTIEPVVQNAAERELAAAIDKWGADAGGVVVMDPHTGAIVAMAAIPDFDPGQKVSDINILPNPLVERVFEMGSVMKPLTMAAGFDAGVVNPETTFNDKGSVTLNNRTIMNFDLKTRGTVTMQEVINNSLNTGMVFVMQQLGRERFRQYMLGYGLGEKTGIDLPGEISGLVSGLSSKEEVNYATAAFGQGIAVTPIEATRALASLSNGGNIVTPYVVKSVRYADGTTKETQPQVVRQVISRTASDTITNVLVHTVDDALVGGKYRMERYAVAAKTGTAQIVGPGGKYYDDRYLHSFFGYFPAYNPKFIGFMYIVYPKNGARYASETLTENFMNLTKFMINYYELPPDREGVQRQAVTLQL